MRRALSHIIIIMVIALFIACQNEDGPIQSPRPSIDKTSLSLKLGERDTLIVSNADNIIATPSSDIVEVEIKGCQIIVSAIKVGNTTISITANQHSLSCAVTVTAEPTSTNEFEDELNDNRSKYTSPTLSMYYDTPGTMFSAADDNTIEVRNLTTGDHIKFHTPQMTIGELANMTLVVNNEPITLISARLERDDDFGTWINLTAIDGSKIVLVVSDID